jgi:transposase
MSHRPDLNQLSNEQLRALTADLFDCMENKDRALIHRDAVIEKLTHEVAILKRHKFAQRSEQLDAVQSNLLDELIDSDLAAIDAELGELTADEAPTPPKKQPKRAQLPPELPRTLIHHEPENTQCRCDCQLKRVGENISEKLDYVPGEFTVERHIRGKWACEQCETLIQAPVPPQVIDKGIPTAGLLAQVLVAKYSDHLPLYHQERIFGRAGLTIPRWLPGWEPAASSYSPWWGH